MDQQDFIPDLTKIQGAGKQLLGLINDILDLSKVEAGKMQLCLERFEIEDLIEDVATTVQPLVQKNSNRLVIDCPSKLGTMQTDLRQDPANTVQSFEQRRQVYRAGDYHARCEAPFRGRRKLDSVPRLRHWDRHDDITDGKVVSGLFSSRCFDNPEIRGNWAGPGDQP